MDRNNINPTALALLVISCGIVLALNRQSAVKAIMVTALFIPLGQMFVVGPLHIRFVPILILTGLVRTILRGELSQLRLTKVDKFFIASCSASLICTCLRGASPETFGEFFNAVGAYFVFRALITESDDITATLRLLALVGFGMGMVMLYEHFTGRDPLYVLGGVPKFDDLRDGKPRCHGAFRNPLMAGAFGATLLPLMIGLWLQKGQQRPRAILGVIGSMIITITAVSSGALLTFMAGIIGTALWRFRKRMRNFRRGIVVTLIALQIVMKAPVWYLIAKISDVFGGSGWHRSFLIDRFFKYFNEWWLIGTSYTAHWGPGGETVIGNQDMMDITNHYIGQALMGGLLGLVLFICMLVSCFKIVGRLVHADGCGTLTAPCLWMLGVTMGAHCVAFISVWYFDQITMYWTWLVATISSLAVIQDCLESAAPVVEDQGFDDPPVDSPLKGQTAPSYQNMAS